MHTFFMRHIFLLKGLWYNKSHRIHSNQKVETTQMPMDRRKDTHSTEQSHSGVAETHNAVWSHSGMALSS